MLAGRIHRGLESTSTERAVNGVPELREGTKPEALYQIKGVGMSDKGFVEVEGIEKVEGE